MDGYMRFQCSLKDCRGEQPWTVNANSFEEGERKMATHWRVEHDLDDDVAAKPIDVVVRLGLA